MFSTQMSGPNGELPDLISHLLASYPESKKDNESFEVFCTRYLSENRPSEVFPVDNNYGFLLTNGQRLKLCPDANAVPNDGSMRNTGSVDITRR